MRRPLLPLLLCAGLLAAACRAPEGPADRYRSFAEAARAGAGGMVWGMLSAASRRELAQRARTLAVPPPPAGVGVAADDLVLGDLATTAPKVKSVTVLRESPSVAVVAVELEGGTSGEATLVREGGVWRVELPRG
jgi:hypothetical protein